jgi:hypothetical protein
MANKRQYTKSEVQYIRENMYRFKPQTISDKLDRPLQSICEIVNYYRKHDKGELWDYTFIETCKILRIHHASLRLYIQQKKIVPIYNFGIKRKRFVFSRYDLRDYVIRDKRASLKEYKCLDCSASVIGDLFCRKHIPSYLVTKNSVPDRLSFQLNNDPEIIKKLGEIFLKLRQEKGKTQTDVCRKMKKSNVHQMKKTRAFENGQLSVLPLHQIVEFYNVLDCSIKLIIERNPKTW